MRRLLVSMFLCGSALAQNHNPQPSFASQVLAAGPSLYLNFNDTTSAFKDQVSGLTFTGTANVTPAVGTACANAPASGFTSTSCTLAANTGDTLLAYTVRGASFTSITDSQGTTATSVSGASSGTAGIYTYVFRNVGSGSHTITMNFSSSVSYQVLEVIDIPNAGVIDASAVNSSSVSTTSWTSGAVTTTTAKDLLVGFAELNVGSYTVTPPVFTALSGGGWTGIFPAYYSAATAGSYAFTGNASLGGYASALVAFKPATVSSGSVTVRQPGFDSAQINQTSAAFPYNGWNAAPNGTISSQMEWNTPWSFTLQIDRFNWDRTGTLVLASKGDSSSTTNSWWKLYVQMNGNQSQLIFERNGYGLPQVGGSGLVQNGVGTAGGFDVMPNGFGYTITVTDNGTGNNSSSTSSNALSLYVNGLQVGASNQVPGSTFTNSYAVGFGGVVFGVSGGTGYANTTAFTSTGGGPNCVVAGTFASTSGVPQAGGFNASADYGCTSLPTLTMISPTGVGAALAATALVGATMNQTTYPLMIPGYVSAGTYYGIDPTDSAQTTTYIDEAAIFSSAVSQTTIQSLFYLTKFWQGVVNTIPTTPYTLVFDNDGCSDTDNLYALALTIAAQRIGYIRLAGVVSSTSDGQSPAMYRQMLDEAGLNHIPVTVPSSVFGPSTLCTATELNIYNASTPQSTSAYPSAKSMYRQVFAANPTTPVFIMLGGSYRGVADLMQSTADGISSLTGAQLVAQNAANGGAIYAQGLVANFSFVTDNSLEDWMAGQYVTNNNGALPIYFYGGEPQNTGPGILSTRTGKDPLYNVAFGNGTDVRAGYDSLPTQAFMSPIFAGGVNIAISGSGSGYAASTPFTSTGGGPNCIVTGFMLSTGGIPSSIISRGGASDSGSPYPGIGSGCLTPSSPPAIILTLPTGVGVTLAATTTIACGKVTITGLSAGSTSTSSCSNQYFVPFSQNATTSPTSGVVMTWFINSLNDQNPVGAPRIR